MPPARARAFVDDSKPDGASAKERSTATAVAGSRPRKTAAVTTLAGNSSKDSASNASSNTAAGTTINNSGNAQSGGGTAGITWAQEDPSMLHAYRTAYRLETPSSFHSALNAAVLNSPGIGKHSPTMARLKEKRKMPKEQLALAVRKHFNGLAVNESDVVVDFLYAVKAQALMQITDRGFKMRFAPRKAR